MDCGGFLRFRESSRDAESLSMPGKRPRQATIWAVSGVRLLRNDPYVDKAILGSVSRQSFRSSSDPIL